MTHLIYRDASLRLETEVCRAWKHALRRVQVHGFSANPTPKRREEMCEESTDGKGNMIEIDMLHG